MLKSSLESLDSLWEGTDQAQSCSSPGGQRGEQGYSYSPSSSRMAVGSQSHRDLCFPTQPGAEGLEMQPGGTGSSSIPKPAVFSRFCGVSQLMDSHQQDFARNESWVILPNFVMPQVVGAERHHHCTGDGKWENLPWCLFKPSSFNFFFPTQNRCCR